MKVPDEKSNQTPLFKLRNLGKVFLFSFFSFENILHSKAALKGFVGFLICLLIIDKLATAKFLTF